MHAALNLDEDTLADFCKRHRIRRLSLFGSYLKGVARPESDLDLLVEFEPESIPGLLGMAGMENRIIGDAGWPGGRPAHGGRSVALFPGRGIAHGRASVTAIKLRIFRSS